MQSPESQELITDYLVVIILIVLNVLMAVSFSD